MERGADRFFALVDSTPLPATLRGEERIQAQLNGAARAIGRQRDFLRLFILLLLSGHATEAVRRVRVNGRARLHELLAAAFPDEDGTPNRPLADELADALLAMFDGAFLAVQNDPKLSYAMLLSDMASAISALARERLRGSSGEAARRRPRRRR